MKKLLMYLMIALLMFSFVACSSTNQPENIPDQPVSKDIISTSFVDMISFETG